MDELTLSININNNGNTEKLKSFKWTKEAVEMLLDIYGNH